jgi:hypothetical protein
MNGLMQCSKLRPSRSPYRPERADFAVHEELETHAEDIPIFPNRLVHRVEVTAIHGCQGLATLIVQRRDEIEVGSRATRTAPSPQGELRPAAISKKRSSTAYVECIRGGDTRSVVHARGRLAVLRRAEFRHPCTPFQKRAQAAIQHSCKTLSYWACR